ncbi:hypothetical protein PYW08_012999 [Mythimna loreyi]|uniref:Uncharacterized protein n=1 Tax=Mythimna loreyi TaxID=667449 RepID=A0ACC2Q159_9NEOP|nr:hypothetical protein PYW08_012999 [Mythimna loreyi]
MNKHYYYHPVRHTSKLSSGLIFSTKYSESDSTPCKIFRSSSESSSLLIFLFASERKKDACERIRFCAALRQSDLDSRTPMTSLINFYSSSWHSVAHRGIDDQLFCRDGKITIDKN